MASNSVQICATLCHFSSLLCVTTSILLCTGANVRLRDSRGRTAFIWASEEGHLDVINALFAAGGVDHTLHYLGKMFC